jgi:hypothetical protein
VPERKYVKLTQSVFPLENRRARSKDSLTYLGSATYAFCQQVKNRLNRDVKTEVSSISSTQETVIVMIVPLKKNM